MADGTIFGMMIWECPTCKFERQTRPLDEKVL